MWCDKRWEITWSWYWSEASIHYPNLGKPKFSNVCHELNLTIVYLISCSVAKVCTIILSKWLGYLFEYIWDYGTKPTIRSSNSSHCTSKHCIPYFNASTTRHSTDHKGGIKKHCASIIQLHHAPQHLTCSMYPHYFKASIPVIGSTR